MIQKILKAGWVMMMMMIIIIAIARHSHRECYVPSQASQGSFVSFLHTSIDVP